MKMLHVIVRVFKIIIFVLIPAILMTGCNQPSDVMAMEAVQLDNTTQLQTQGKAYTVLFSPAIDSMPLNKYFDLDVQIKGATYQTLTFPLDMEIDAGMKAHNHSMNVIPRIINLGEGKFRVEGMLFHMPGKWFLRFIIRRGAMSDKAEVNLVVAS